MTSSTTQNHPTERDTARTDRQSTVRVSVAPALFRWAVERSGKDLDGLRRRFPKLDAWEREEAHPTLRQVEAFAKATYVPVGYFFLDEPLVEEVPIPDLRTIEDKALGRPSGNLLDTIYICQRRQDWYREYAVDIGEEPLPFIGSVNLDGPIAGTAAQIRRDLAMVPDMWRSHSNWEAAFREFVRQVEDAGILVMVNGVVGQNNHRKLEPREFRGFALCDSLAPLVFINGADAKAAQMFTLAHELAHLWHGESALSDVNLVPSVQRRVEAWCNRVAAELLLPLDDIEATMLSGNPLDQVQSIMRRFKVSSLVVLRRLYEAGRLSEDELRDAYDTEYRRIQSSARSGGNYYPTLLVRVSHRFARAVVRNALDGETLYRDAFGLLGIRKSATFDELRQQLGY